MSRLVSVPQARDSAGHCSATRRGVTVPNQPPCISHASHIAHSGAAVFHAHSTQCSLLFGRKLRPRLGSVWARATNDTTRNTASTSVGSEDFLDHLLLEALNAHNLDVNQDYHQVVLLSPSSEFTRAHIPWPPNTVIYHVFPPASGPCAPLDPALQSSDAEVASSASKQPRASYLIRQVPSPAWWPGRIVADLAAAGYRSNRLSVWILDSLDEFLSCSGADAGETGGGAGAHAQVQRSVSGSTFDTKFSSLLLDAGEAAANGSVLGGRFDRAAVVSESLAGPNAARNVTELLHQHGFSGWAVGAGAGPQAEQGQEVPAGLSSTAPLLAFTAVKVDYSYEQKCSQLALMARTEVEEEDFDGNFS